MSSSFLFWGFFMIFCISQDISEARWGNIGDKCIQVYEKGVNFHSAKSSCERMGMSLFSIDNQAELNFMAEFRKNVNMWIGLTYIAAKKKWFWVDGREFVRPDWWKSNEPRHKVVAYIRDGQLNGIYPSYRIYYICQKKAHKVWTKVNSSDYYLCGIEIMPNCEGLSCEEVCQSHPNCDQFAKMLNVCVNIKNETRPDNCVVKMRPNSELYHFNWSCEV